MGVAGGVGEGVAVDDGVSVGVGEGFSTSAWTRALMSGVGVGAVVGPQAAMRMMATATGQYSCFMPPFSHIVTPMRTQKDRANLASMPKLKYPPPHNGSASTMRHRSCCQAMSGWWDT